MELSLQLARHLSTLSHLEEVALNDVRLQNETVATLLRSPSLREVRLRGSTVVSALSDLQTSEEIEGERAPIVLDLWHPDGLDPLLVKRVQTRLGEGVIVRTEETTGPWDDDD